MKQTNRFALSGRGFPDCASDRARLPRPERSYAARPTAAHRIVRRRRQRQAKAPQLRSDGSTTRPDTCFSFA